MSHSLSTVHERNTDHTKGNTKHHDVWITLTVAHCPLPGEFTYYKEAMNCLILELKCCLDTTNDVTMLMNADFINVVQIILAM